MAISVSSRDSRYGMVKKKLEIRYLKNFLITAIISLLAEFFPSRIL
jgi:hypothetical protein